MSEKPPFDFVVGEEAVKKIHEHKFQKFDKLPNGHTVMYKGVEYAVAEKHPENLTVTLSKDGPAGSEFGLEAVDIDTLTFTINNETL